MINQKSILAVDQSKFSKDFVAPLYDSYSFANINATIEKILIGETKGRILPEDVFGNLPLRYNKVILFLIDAFGWRVLEKYSKRYPLLQTIVKEGVVSKITSQFPSTTASCFTTINLGLPVGKSGVFEWYYYEPKLDRMFAPLRFSYAGDKERNTLSRLGVSPKGLYPSETFYKKLKKRQVRSNIFLNKEFSTSPYNQVINAGATIFPFRTIPEALVNLVKLLLKEEQKSYFFIYFNVLDSMSHNYGPESRQFEAELDVLMMSLEQLFYQQVKGKCKDTLIIFTADHGQVEMDFKKTIYLNKRSRKIKEYLKTNQKGEFLVLGGSCRDFFLYIKSEYLEEAQKYLEKILLGKAEVYQTKDLIKKGLFGSEKPSRVFLNRLGNLVILPYRYESVWWYEKGKFDEEFLGHHGGLTREEVEIPLLLLPL